MLSQMKKAYFINMDHDELVDTSESHQRTIIHIDIDCFYAQVEEIRNPLLRRKPLGIQQKNIIVTCNYTARQFGVRKLMLLSEAKKLCPQLTLVNGEDLTNYRKMSSRIFDVLLTFTPLVEKLGMDENWLDVSDVVNQKMQELGANCIPTAEEYIYPDNKSLGSCNCGCEKRLALGSQLATEIRQQLFQELGITSCAGIAHNKLMAKIVGTKNKPNKQTVLAPKYSQQMLREMTSLRSITGIGEKTEQILNEINVKTVRDLQDVELDYLKPAFGHEQATKLKDFSFGIDNSIVKTSGKPKTISLEDSCKSLSLRAEVEEKFRVLVARLTVLVADDGRIPISIKIILRKFDSAKRVSHRETKQMNIHPTIFKEVNGKVELVDGGQQTLLDVVMKLFEKTIDMRKSFNITLLGLAFTKFKAPNKGPLIANYLIKKSDIEVQSITSFSSDGCSPNTSSCENHRRHDMSRLSSSPMGMDLDAASDTMSVASCSSDISESDQEPSPKKKRGFLFAKRRSHLTPIDCYDASPSKLSCRVGDLRLNSREFDAVPSTSTATHIQPKQLNAQIKAATSTPSNKEQVVLSNEVFKELPQGVQRELLGSWRVSRSSTPTSAKAKSNTLH
ncbi:DNA polymerase iota, partial [Pseudolycoriella hygida]